ncbi:MAG: sulfatase-like hydrolase/transferase [Synergistaceae bacterium]|jgi:membrane-anchored protein YejM (alkaline phosphatase superfamily)|nr:sulfatase-like hydrolase/transferase [Synergistaceae bacterium]
MFLTQATNSSARFLAQVRLSLLVTLVTLPFLLFFLYQAPRPESFGQWLYLASALAYYTFGLLLLPLVLFPLALTRPTGFLPVFFFWAWLLFLIVDTFVFVSYTYHIDLEVLLMVAADFHGLGIPLEILILFGLLAGGLLVVLLLVHRRLEGGKGTRRRFTPALAALTLSAVLFGLNSLIHGGAAANGREDLILYDSFLPFYRPFTRHSAVLELTHRFPGLFPTGGGQALEARGQGPSKPARYPLKPLEFRPEKAGSSGPNPILFIVLESWQFAAMNPEITPNIWTFSQSADRFTNHLSSGVGTIQGLFGLMYGIHPPLYDALLHVPESYPSVFTEALNDQGYEARVFTGSDIGRHRLRTLFFSKVKPENYHTAADAVLVERFLASLASPAEADRAGPNGRNPTEPLVQTARPRFDFIFLVSSHTPYSHPPEFARFQPTPEIRGGYIFDRDTDPKPYLNAYRNSLYYLDSLVGSILAALRERGLYDRTWIVVTGDHAEEFNENGRGHWGHGNNFSRWQTATPLVVKRPGQTQGRIVEKRSFHQDVVPTLMEEALGCLTDHRAYADGINLYRLPAGERATVVSSYFDTAYIVGDTVLEKLRRKRYSLTDMSPLPKTAAEKLWLRAMLKEERRFISGAPK